MTSEPCFNLNSSRYSSLVLTYQGCFTLVNREEYDTIRGRRRNTKKQHKPCFLVWLLPTKTVLSRWVWIRPGKWKPLREWGLGFGNVRFIGRSLEIVYELLFSACKTAIGTTISGTQHCKAPALHECVCAVRRYAIKLLGVTLDSTLSWYKSSTSLVAAISIIIRVHFAVYDHSSVRPLNW